MISEQYKKYLPWLFLLVVAKFVWMPMIESRNEQKLELNSVYGQIARTQDVINNKALYQRQKQTLSQAVAEREAHFYQVEDGSAFRLDVQKQLEAIAQQVDLQVDSINWFEPLSEDDIVWYNLEIKLSGAVDDVAAFHRALVSGDKTISISALDWRTKSTRSADWQWKVQSAYRLSIPVLEASEQ